LLRQCFESKGTILRFGGLVGGDRLAGRFLAGKKNIINGKSPVNMIHRDDCIGVIQSIINQDTWGKVLNATSDGHPSRKKFYTSQAKKYGFEKPVFSICRKATGKIVSNKVMKDTLGYQFIHPDPMEF